MQYNDVTIYQTPEEIENLRTLVKEADKIEGDMAEVGVFQGASASIIREHTKKELWLFDTFKGFPDMLDVSDDIRYSVGDCAASQEWVNKLMDDEDNTHIVRGIFPETSAPIVDKRFSFVHIDVDIYESTKLALLFFYPRMTKGGIILVHDYPAHQGVKKALDELGYPKEVLGGRQAVVRV